MDRDFPRGCRQSSVRIAAGARLKDPLPATYGPDGRTGEFDHRADWLRIDNTDLQPDEVAERIIRHFSLRRAAGG